MKIAYITMIKDEQDIILDNLNYYKKLGIKDFYIIENGSSDDTLNLITKFKNDNINDIKVYIEVDKDVGYWQYLRINKLANIAYNDGCEYILPVDADEFLFKEKDGKDFNLNFTAESIIENLDTNIDCYFFHWWYFRKKDSSPVTRPVFDILDRDLYPSLSYTKILVKWKPGMEISQGNHTLHYIEKYKTDKLNNVYFAHYNLRGYEHCQRKVINLGKAYKKIEETMKHPSIDTYNRYLKEGESVIWEIVNQEKLVTTELYTKIKKVLL
jgi:hypothetical protein